jgi:hypothetical protein
MQEQQTHKCYTSLGAVFHCAFNHYVCFMIRVTIYGKDWQTHKCYTSSGAASNPYVGCGQKKSASRGHMMFGCYSHRTNNTTCNDLNLIYADCTPTPGTTCSGAAFCLCLHLRGLLYTVWHPGGSQKNCRLECSSRIMCGMSFHNINGSMLSALHAY